MSNPPHPLRLNVGFLVSAAIGTNRDFAFEYERMQLGEDLTLTEFGGTARFSRTPQGLLLQADFHGSVMLECVRCLSDYKQFLHWEFTDLYAFDRRSITESNLLVPETGQIDLAPLLREYAFLEFPIRPICKPDCKGLCPVCGANRNENDCGHASSSADSPFAALKEFFD